MKGPRVFRRMPLPRWLTRQRAKVQESAQLTDLYATLVQSNQAMLRATSEADLFRDICRICVDYGHFGLAWLAVLKDGQLCTAAAEGPMKGYLDGLEVSADPNDPLGRGPTGRAFRGERSVVCENWEGDPQMDPWRERGARFGICSSGSFPVPTQEGVAAVLTLYAGQQGHFYAEKVALLEELTRDLAFALDKFRMERRRRMAEEQLQEERTLYQDLVTTQPAGVYRLRVGPVQSVTPDEWESLHRTQYQAEFVSDRFCEISGISRIAFQSVPGAFLDRIHPDDREDFSQRNAEALTWMTPFRWEGRLMGDVGPRWIRLESLPRVLPDGGSLWTGILTDITERRNTTSEYRRAYSLLRQAEAIAKIGGWEIDLEANTLFWSDEIFRIYELDPKSYTPTLESSLLFYAPEWRPVITHAVQRAIDCGENFDLDLELLTATGRRLWVHATSQVVLRNGRVVKIQGAFRDIAEERLAAETLAKNHAVLEGIMESAEGPIFSLDRAYAYTSYNLAHAATMKALYGADISLGSCLLDHQSVPQDRTAAKANLDRALAGESFTEEGSSGTADRSRRFFEVSHTPIREAEGGVIGVAVMARDTTERRRSEASLCQVKDLLGQAESLAKVGGWELDIDTQDLFWTEQTFRIHDLEPQADPPKVEAAIQFYAPEWRPLVVEKLQRSIQSGEPFGFEAELVTATDRHIWVQVNGKALQREGRVTRLVGAIQDISERKRNEIVATEALAKARRLGKALDQIPSFIYMKDRERRYVYANQSTLDLFGCTADELVGSDDSRFFPPDTVAKLHAVDTRILEHGEPTAEEIVSDHGGGGRHVYWELKTPIYDEADPGQIWGLCGISTDISERKLAEDFLQASEEKNRALIRAIPDLVFTNGLDGEYLDAHVSDPSLLFLAPEAFLHRRIDEVLPGPIATRYLAAYRKAIDTNLVQELEYMLPIGGEEKFFEARVVRCTEDSVITIVRDITDRERVETALRESEQRYRVVFETSADGLVLVDRETLAIINANPAFCALYGYTLGELQTMNAIEISAEQEATRQSLAQSGDYRIGHRWHRRKDGTRFPIELVAKEFEDGGRSITLASVRDISQRLQEEADLRSRVNQLQIMLDLAALPDRHSGKDLLREGLERLVHLTGSKVGFLHLLLEDQETLELTAWTAETMKHCTASFDTHYPVAMAGIWADAVRTRKPVIHNDYPVRADRKGMPEGHFPLTREIVVPVVESGKVRMIVGVGNKPTEYDELDVGQLEVVAGDLWKGYARQLVVSELMTSEANLRATFDQALVGIVHMGFDGRISRANQRFGDILGYGLNDLIGTEIARFTHPEDQFQEGVMFQDILRNMGGSLIQEKRYLAADDSIVWVQLLASLVSPRENEPGYILKVVEDITDRKRLEAEVQEMNRELERRVEQRTHQLEVANQELEAFSYSVSHDLRAPLRAISGFSEALKLDADSHLSPAGMAHLQRVQGGAIRMAQLIEDLLHLSRVGRDDFLSIPMDLSVLADQVLTGLRASNPERQVTCQVEHPLRVQGDPRLIRILLENLLGNAWKFTALAQEAAITVSARPLEHGLVEISIRDNGVGFPATQVGKLFTPFQRLHKQEEFPGTGIGLAIAKRIVSQHGGMIRAEGDVGRGAAIHFTLPLAKKERS